MLRLLTSVSQWHGASKVVAILAATISQMPGLALLLIIVETNTVTISWLAIRIVLQPVNVLSLLSSVAPHKGSLVLAVIQTNQNISVCSASRNNPTHSA